MHYSYLLLVLPAVAVPFLLRFIYIRIIFTILKRKAFPFLHSVIYEGWEDPNIRRLMDDISRLAESKVNKIFPLKFNLIGDGKELLFVIQQQLRKKKESENPQVLHLDFSPERLIQCTLLLLNDIYREYHQKWWFKRIINLKLHWFRRGDSLRKRFSALLRVPVIKELSGARLFGPIARLLLIPLIGPPFLIVFLIRSFVISLLWEGWMRYLYAIILIRSSYYFVFLYTKHNEQIERRLQIFDEKNISAQREHFSDFLDPHLWHQKSPGFASAAKTYMECLDVFGYPRDKKFAAAPVNDAGKIQSILWEIAHRIFKSSKSAVKKQLDMYSHPDYASQLIMMANSIGNEYYPGQQYIDRLCIHDLLAVSYIGSLYLLSHLYSAPFASPLLRSFSIDFLFKIKEISETDLLQYALKGVRYSGKIGSLLFRAKKGFAVLKGGTGAVSLAVSLGTPIIYQHIEDSLVAFLFHRYGRLLILLFEESVKRPHDKVPLNHVF